MEPVRWSIIGTGNIAHEFAKDLALVQGRQEIVAVAGHSEKSTKEFADNYHIPNAFTKIDDLIGKVATDLAYVASPHTLHHEQTLALLNNGIHVLCEKPMTINAEQCKELIAAAAVHNAFLMEGMWIRFLPSLRIVLDLIREERIGRIVSVKASMCHNAPYDPESRFFDPELGGGSLLDLGIYPVFLSLLLLGKPDTIKAIGTLSDQGIDETCSVLFHYRGGQHAVLESSLMVKTDLPAEIAGDKGVIKILNPWYEKSAGIEVEIYNEGKIVYPCRWEGHGLQYEIEEVLECVKDNKIMSELLPHSFSLMLVETMDEIRNQIKVTYDMYE